MGDCPTEVCGFCRAEFQPDGTDWADYEKCDYCANILCKRCVNRIDEHTKYCSNCVEG